MAKRGGALVEVVLRNAGQQRVRLIKLVAQHERLELHEAKQQRVAHHRELFVNEVDALLCCEVAEKIKRSVEVVEDCDFAADAVVEAPGGVVVYEAVADPEAGAHALLHLHARLCWFPA